MKLFIKKKRIKNAFFYIANSYVNNDLEGMSLTDEFSGTLAIPFSLQII
jgi:hypothetical protein